VLEGVYVDDVLGAYVVKEDARFQRIVRVLKCEGNGRPCSGIAGRNKDDQPALCAACDPLTVPTYLLQHAKGSQVDRAAKLEEVPDDFHYCITPTKPKSTAGARRSSAPTWSCTAR
jgi:hypothetical protein